MSNAELAVALGGGGARSAYQVGTLRGLAARFPDLGVPILTGVSAGAINAAHLANHTGRFADKTANLAELWSTLDTGGVFYVDTLSLLSRAAGIGARLIVPRRRPWGQGMVDTTPLRATLRRSLGADDGELRGVRANLAQGRLRAVALTTTRYSTGQTVTFFSGRGIEAWERPQRRSVEAQLTVDHVMASAALPLFFPAVSIDGDYYGDGGVRLVAPLAPALHLGARKILAISTRYRRTREEADSPSFAGPPSPAHILGVLYNAIFIDMLEQDAIQLERVNDLLEATEHPVLRQVELLVLRPSRDLGRLAGELEPQLPKTFRFLTRRLGTQRTRSQDFLSTVMFQPDYLHRLLELGERDALARMDEIEAFVAG